MASESDARFEALLAACIEAAGQDGSWSLDETCAQHPEHAGRLRSSLERLQSLGLFEPGAPAAVPDHVGDYPIVARLGRGGMGVVYLARDPHDGRLIALKMGPAPLEPGDHTAARFEREIRAFAGLSHPNVVHVLDVGTIEGRPYYTMEYVPGATLAEIITRARSTGTDGAPKDVAAARAAVHEGASRVEEGRTAGPDDFGRTWVEFSCRAVLDVARALAHVHAHGIVHRDVKPANVIVREDGRALLFDLGLARVDEGPGITRTGDFAGTPHYVSPEVALGDARAADARSDVFSLGVTLFELLTLRRPFEGEAAAQVLTAITDREPPLLRQVDPDLPRDLETICSSALEKDPARRYASMEELAADLERFLAFQPVRARPVSTIERATRFARRRPALASAVVLAAIVVIGFPAGLLVANHAIRGERDRAEASAREARTQLRTSTRVVEFLTDLFHLQPGRSHDLRATEMLERGARSAQSEFDDQPLVRAALLESLGRVYASSGDAESALQLLDRSLAIRQRDLGEDHPDTARTLEALGIVHLGNGELASARALFQRALGAATRASMTQPGLAATIRARLGSVLLQLGDTAGARDELDQAARDMSADGKSPLLARVLEELGRAQTAQNQLDEAAVSLQRSLEILGQAFVPDLEGRARVLDAVADVRDKRGQHDEALALRAQAARLHEGSRSRPSTPSTFAEWSVADGERLLEAFAPAWQRDYDRTFQTGITALQSSDTARAVEAFQRCLGWRPRNPVCAYNIACAFTSAGDIDAGLDWLARAIELGAGRSPELTATIDLDSDIAPLRAQARGRELVDRMHADARIQDPAPRTFVPAEGSPDAGFPLVVVLREGPGAEAAWSAWTERARSMSFAVLAPSAHWVVGTSEDDGRAWVATVSDFAKRPWAYEEPIVAALTAFCETNRVDPRRVFVVGEGTGALVAFDLAARAPGLVRGALIVDGPVHAALSAESAVAAAAAGSSVRVLVADPTARAGAVELYGRFLAHCGFEGPAVRALEGASQRDAGVGASLADLLALPPQQR